jgi:hypothetical protein
MFQWFQRSPYQQYFSHIVAISFIGRGNHRPSNININFISEASAVNATVLFYLPPYMMTESLVANISSYSVTYENGVATIEVNILYTYTLYLVININFIA